MTNKSQKSTQKAPDRAPSGPEDRLSPFQHLPATEFERRFTTEVKVTFEVIQFGEKRFPGDLCWSRWVGPESKGTFQQSYIMNYATEEQQEKSIKTLYFEHYFQRWIWGIIDILPDFIQNKIQ